jgi:hypothetical protein
MIEQYGLSAEREHYQPIATACKFYEPFDSPWAWHVDRDYPSNMYIYVKNDAVLSNIQLKWH